jgi:hypothetical protein
VIKARAKDHIQDRRKKCDLEIAIIWRGRRLVHEDPKRGDGQGQVERLCLLPP